MITKLRIIKYQRNGSAGNGFYVASFNHEKIGFIATFETNNAPDENHCADEDTVINPITCRVVSPNSLDTAWDGPYFAQELQRKIDRKRFTMNTHPKAVIYDLCETGYKRKLFKKSCQHPSPSKSGFCDDCGKFIK